MGIAVGICGAGSFSRNFIPLFAAHPEVDRVVLADFDAEKRKGRMEEFGIVEGVSSLADLCALDLDAIAIFTQNWLHGPQAVEALDAGKHVYSAVPSAITVDEMRAIVEAADRSGRTYMVGETSYYYPNAIYCRKRFAEGAFGGIVYGEGEYLHDFDHGLYDVYKWRGGEQWREIAGSPPMHYPTHSVSMIVSVTGARAIAVSAQGFTDHHADGLFRAEVNRWNNEFSNESALYRMSDGSALRINEFRRVGHPGTVGMSLYGTEGSFEEQSGAPDGPAKQRIWVTKDREAGVDLSDSLDCRDRDGFTGVSEVHETSRLPASFRGLHNGHQGSHQFLIHDFVRACVSGDPAPNDARAAARYLLPGLIAHESALRGGELLEIPDFGEPGVGPR